MGAIQLHENFASGYFNASLTGQRGWEASFLGTNDSFHIENGVAVAHPRSSFNVGNDHELPDDFDAEGDWEVVMPLMFVPSGAGEPGIIFGWGPSPDTNFEIHPDSPAQPNPQATWYASGGWGGNLPSATGRDLIANEWFTARWRKVGQMVTIYENDAIVASGTIAVINLSPIKLWLHVEQSDFGGTPEWHIGEVRIGQLVTPAHKRIVEASGVVA